MPTYVMLTNLTPDGVKVSVELGSRGTMTSQTLAAMPTEDLAGAL